MTDMSEIENIIFRDERNRNVVIEGHIEKKSEIEFLEEIHYALTEKPIQKETIDYVLDRYHIHKKNQMDEFSAKRKALREGLTYIYNEKVDNILNTKKFFSK